MLRSRAIRPIVSAISVYPRARGQLNLGSSCSLTQSIIRTSRPTLPQPSPNPPTFQKAWFKTSSTGLLATKKQTGKDFEQERARHREQKLKPDPEGVSSTSTVRAVFEPRARVENSSDPDPDMLRGIRNDLVSTCRTGFSVGSNISVPEDGPRDLCSEGSPRRSLLDWDGGIVSLRDNFY